MNDQNFKNLPPSKLDFQKIQNPRKDISKSANLIVSLVINCSGQREKFLIEDGRSLLN